MRPRLFVCGMLDRRQLILAKDLIQAEMVSRLRSDRYDATHCAVFVIPAQAGIHLKNRFQIKLVLEKSGIRNDRGYPTAIAAGWVMDRTIIHTLKTSGLKAPREIHLSGRNPERASRNHGFP